jgi:hypothetical protein
MTLNPRPPKPLLKKVAIKVYNATIFRNIIPEEASLSFPVPIYEDNETIFSFFHYWNKGAPGQKQRGITRPLTYILVRLSPEPDLFEIIDCQFSEPDKPLFPDLDDPFGLPPVKLNKIERQQLTAALYLSCEQISSSTDAEMLEEAKRVYRMSLHRLVWPGLLPFYHAINPRLLTNLE